MMTKVSWSKLPVSLMCVILSYCTLAGSDYPELISYNKLEETLLLENSHFRDSEGTRHFVNDLECQNDVVVTIQDIFNCDTTVYFAPPIVTVSTGYLGISQTSGPTSDSAPGAGDGTPLVPGLYEVVYEFTDTDGVVHSCSIGIDVRSSYEGVMSCQNLNVSVDENCEILISPFMILTNTESELGCSSNYDIEITDEYGNIMGVEAPDGVILTADALQKQLTVSVDVVGGGNSCWSTLTLEDKFPPQITCPDGPIITTCNGVDLIDLPISADNCANEAHLVIIDEEYEPMECHEVYLSRIMRTYVAVDGNGIESIPCVVEILVKRIVVADIEFPSDITPFSGSGIACDENYAIDAYGHPHPNPMTGSGTGVPYIYGNPLNPGQTNPTCNVLVNYTDQVLSHGCTTKIMRSWNVREWHCLGEFQAGSIQIIEIVDEEGPVVTPIDTIYGSTIYECEGAVLLPPVEAYDECGDISHVDISYPGGFLENSNGGYVNLPIGPNHVTYTVYDGCYNSTSIDVVVWISDTTQPVTVCEINTVVSLPNSGNVEVWAETFDDGSHDECGIADIVVRRMDPSCTDEDIEFDDSVFFCCGDVGNEVMVVLRVIDHGGNFNECMVVVHVQDKIIPELACPADMTIYCTDPYDLDNPNAFFGEPIVSDNCSNPTNVQQRFLTEVNQCNTGILEREIFITDDSGDNIITSCIQRITVLPIDAFTADDITWPEDYYLDGCNTNDLEPDRLDPLYSYPVVLEGSCDLIGFNWDDDVFVADPNTPACYKIIRHWTLINWCELIDDEYTTYEYDQVLIISNVIDPTITCAPATFSTTDGNCDEVPIDVSVMGMDDCTMDLTYKWSIDLDANGIYEHTGIGYNIQGLYPVGDHLIEWVVTDLCGNDSYCIQPLKIFNNKVPQAICIYGLSVDLNPMDTDGDGEIDNEMVVLWANDFDKESFQPCGNEVIASFSADTTDTSLELDCNDIGIYYVDLWVTDVNTGLSAICQTFVDVQDNNGVEFCADTGGLRAEVGGRIHTEDDLSLENVEVNLMGSPLVPDMTDEEGTYAFPNMPLGGAYELEPVKNDDYHNGVSTIDIVLIQRHILGISALDSPYKMIAADVNNSESISGIDLITIRKLILGVYDEFPQVGSWTFIDEDHQFAFMDNPWMTPFNETYEISSLDNDMDVNFVGVKMGDVNNSAITNLFADNDTESRAASKSLHYEISNSQYGTAVNIYASEDFTVNGAQMVIDLGDQFVGESLMPGAWNIATNQYRFVENKLIVSYNEKVEISSEANEPLFSIEGAGTINHLAFVEDLLQAEMYDEQMNVVDLNLLAKGLDKFAVSTPNPNPFSSETNIDVAVEEAQEGKINIYNTQGQLVNSKNISLRAGNNTITLTHSDFNEYGTMMIRIQTKSFDHNMLVVHIK